MIKTKIPISSQSVHISAAYQRVHTIPCAVPAEGDDKINQPNKHNGGILYFYVENISKEAITLTDIRWETKSFNQQREAYQAIWYRSFPATIDPGESGEISLCLRRELTEAQEFQLIFGKEPAAVSQVEVTPPPYRFETIVFTEDLKTVYFYIGKLAEDSSDDLQIPCPRQTDGKFQWLHGEEPLNGNLLVGRWTYDQPLTRGSAQIFYLVDEKEKVLCGAALHAFSNYTVFGTYGGTSVFADYPRFAANGLTAYNSFQPKDINALDEAESLGLRVAMIIGEQPTADVLGHPAIWAYGPVDEPDCKDYSHDKIPLPQRIGTNAPEMIRYFEHYRQVDPCTPSMLTLDLTFTPYNYFIYGPLADISNPDCYPITCGWSIRVIRDMMTNMKQASAPKPFSYTYQGCWEEWAQPQDHWVDANELRSKGFDFYRDASRVRGFGRPPTPAEVRIPMFYAIGCGAKALFSYTDDTEVSGDLMFHGSADMPELWDEIGRSSRTFNWAAPLIEIAHPVAWAQSSGGIVWLSTLLAGTEAVLVVAVNENYLCSAKEFAIAAADNVQFSFPPLPWLSPEYVYRVEDGRCTPLETSAYKQKIKWRDTVETAQLYLLTAESGTANHLQQRFDELADRQALAAIKEQRKASIKNK